MQFFPERHRNRIATADARGPREHWSTAASLTRRLSHEPGGSGQTPEEMDMVESPRGRD
jgi:hypothetical protein